MYGIETIKAMNREAAEAAEGQEPYIAQSDNDEGVFKCPNFGDYRPDGWKLIDQLFVDNSGFGSEGEAALTPGQFLAKVEKGKGYAVIEQGQFQVYIGVFDAIR